MINQEYKQTKKNYGNSNEHADYDYDYVAKTFLVQQQKQHIFYSSEN